MGIDITVQHFNQYLDLIGDGLQGLVRWENEQKAIIGDCEGLSCVVLNANPFTTGQKYLVQLAASRSSKVLVFVIQNRPEAGAKGNHENTGIEFSFQDRMHMVKDGLSDIEKVIILPSGPYLISRSDFPEGFLSEDLGPAPAHAVLDSMVFCHVCLSLGIKTAFAGDEPRDELSEIHLNALRQECRKNNINLKVAERKRLGERYMTSSLARQAIADKDVDELKQIVPQTTLSYLKELCF